MNEAKAVMMRIEEEFQSSLADIDDVLNEVLNDLVTEYFLEPFTSRTSRAVSNMLKIAKLQWESPFDFLECDLYHKLRLEKYPDVSSWTWYENVNMADIVQPGPLAVADAVFDETTWEEFEKAIYKDLETADETSQVTI